MKAKIPCTECGSTDTFTTPAGKWGGKIRYWCMRCVVRKLLDTRRKVRARPTKRDVGDVFSDFQQSIVQLFREIQELRSEVKVLRDRLALRGLGESMASQIRAWFRDNPTATVKMCRIATGYTEKQIRKVLDRAKPD